MTPSPAPPNPAPWPPPDARAYALSVEFLALVESRAARLGPDRAADAAALFIDWFERTAQRDPAWLAHLRPDGRPAFPTPAHWSRYVGVALRRAAARARRDRARFVPLSPLAVGDLPDPADQAQRREELEALAARLPALSERQRALILALLRGQSAAQFARRHGLSRASVSRLLHRALAILQPPDTSPPDAPAPKSPPSPHRPR